MIRTQIYIPESAHKQVAQLAKIRRTSSAYIIREFIESGLQQDHHFSAGTKTLKNLLKIKARGGPKDLSQHLDDYLYGGRGKKKRS